MEKIKSVDEYLKVVFQKTSSRNDEENPQIFWFRGESNANFKTPLVPNAYRSIVEEIVNVADDCFDSHHIYLLERNISAEFQRKSLPYIISKGIDNTAWNRYFLMQHYGIYTRLLDWTENALLALFFAINDNNITDAKVWILNPLKLNNYSINKIHKSKNDYFIIPSMSADFESPTNIIDTTGKLRIEEISRRYLLMDFNPKNKNESNIYYPLAIYPTFLDERMSSQKACFTVFGNKINGLLSINDCSDKLLDSVIIEGNSKEKLLDELRLIGIDFESIYPGISGLGASITEKYKKIYFDNNETINHLLKLLFEHRDQNDK
jgi:hypothetical protein